MSTKSDIIGVQSSIVIPAFVCAAAGATNAVLHQPATFGIDAAGTGYANGAATMVLADGNTIGVTLTTAAGLITAIAWASGYSTDGTDVAAVNVVQAGGSAGSAHVATYQTAGTSSPCLIDFGELIDDPFIQRGRYQYALSGKTVTEHDTAPGSSKTLTVNLFPSDEVLAIGSAATMLADRLVAGSAKTLTNAIDTTQHWSLAAAFTPVARYYYVAFTWTALDAGASFTTQVRLNRV